MAEEKLVSRRSDDREQRDLTVRATFVDLIKRGEPCKTIATELGIALSTAYKWQKLWHARGDAWLAGTPATKAKRIPGKSAQTTRDLVIGTSLENPTMSVRQLTRLLKASHRTRFSVGYVHGVLASAGLSTADQREKRLNELFDEQETQTTSERNPLASPPSDPPDLFAALPFDQPDAPGRIFVHDVIRIRADSVLGGGVINLIVDAHDLRAFGRFARGLFIVKPGDFLDEVMRNYTPRSDHGKTIFTDHGYEFVEGSHRSRYLESARAHGVVVRHHAPKNNSFNPLIRQVWSALKQHLFKDQRDICAAQRKHPAVVSRLIQDFLDARHLQRQASR